MSGIMEPPDAKARLPSGASPFDELHAQDGSLRARWRPLVQALHRMAPMELERRRSAAAAALRDNGVTYNVYDEPDEGRPWPLDIVPFVLSGEDWAAIEAGVLQRARLVDLILRDVYGPQRLIGEGALPPHVVLGHPKFLRPLHGAVPPAGTHLYLYAADLVRAPDGSWRVARSHADAPTGLGYALENRLATAEAFSESFAQMGVARLAAFFNAHRQGVVSRATSRRDRAVLLTPGPASRGYFEHVYLAHALGLTVAEGDDLTARGGALFLKTLTGLEPVATVLRRVESVFCDPLELRGDSAQGVPGLVETVRAGGVVLANALGGAVVESPALEAWLPALARRLLGEELKIAGLDTIWCGTEAGRKQALTRLEHGVLRDAFDGRPLAAAGEGRSRQTSEARLADRGETLVVQEIAPASLAPIFEKGRFEARPLSLRVFAALTPSGWQAMPGGLARIGDGAEGASKDVWVLSGNAGSAALPTVAGMLAIKRQGEAAPSRAMDNLFWLGRYAERTENLVRVLRAVVARAGEEPATAADIARKLLTPFSQASAADGAVGLGAQLQSLIHGRKAGGLKHLLARVENSARSVRDRLSLDTWRAVHVLTEAEPPARDAGFESQQAHLYLDRLVRGAAALAGLAAENMTRGPNWLFLELGRRTERAQHIAWLLRRMLAGADVQESESIRVLLEIADSAMTYRARYLNQLQLAPLLDTLLLDGCNPRAAAFQLAAIQARLEELPRATAEQESDVPGRIVAELRRLLAEAQPEQLGCCKAGTRPALIALTDTLYSDMALLSDALADAYFRHAGRTRTGGAQVR
jgi:uncharacterized circularly permuted ATP-grasp superfamily protein/uncharacterized alpha-E superfamily protein